MYSYIQTKIKNTFKKFMGYMSQDNHIFDYLSFFVILKNPAIYFNILSEKNNPVQPQLLTAKKSLEKIKKIALIMYRIAVIPSAFFLISYLINVKNHGTSVLLSTTSIAAIGLTSISIFTSFIVSCISLQRIIVLITEQKKHLQELRHLKNTSTMEDSEKNKFIADYTESIKSIKNEITEQTILSSYSITMVAITTAVMLTNPFTASILFGTSILLTVGYTCYYMYKKYQQTYNPQKIVNNINKNSDQQNTDQQNNFDINPPVTINIEPTVINIETPVTIDRPENKNLTITLTNKPK